MYDNDVNTNSAGVVEANWDALSNEQKKYYTQLEYTKNEEASSKYVDFSDWVKHICAQPLHILEQSVKEAMIQTSSA